VCVGAVCACVFVEGWFRVLVAALVEASWCVCVAACVCVSVRLCVCGCLCVCVCVIACV